jgi:hypothetical protein
MKLNKNVTELIFLCGHQSTGKPTTFTTGTTNDLLSKVPSNYIVMTFLFEMENSNENNRSRILSYHQPTERKKL